MTYKKRNSGRYAAEWDKGGGWMETKEEWQDYHKAVNKSCTPEELATMWAPASGSWISIHLDHIIEGLTFILDIQPKQYRGKQTRKPVRFLCEGIPGAVGIPLPGSSSMTGGWNEKKTWSSAVKTILNDIIPEYEKYYTQKGHSSPMCLRSMVHTEEK